MGKYIFWIIILLVVLVGIINSVSSLKTFKIGSLNLDWFAPSYKNDGQLFFSETSNIKTQTNNKKIENKEKTSIDITNKEMINKPIEEIINPPPGFSLKDLSPYYKKVKIQNLNPGFYTNSGRITLYANDLKNPVSITNWQIKANQGHLIIPDGVFDYKPSGLFEQSSNIILENQSSVNIYNGTSPIGKNLKINKCLGFLNNHYKFNPDLPCLSPQLFDRSEISTFSGNCQNYIMSLGSCKMPTPSELNSFSSEPLCRMFLDRFSYAGCYAAKRNDQNFFEKEWIVWISGIWPFDQNHDRVLLLDENKLLVDIYTY